MPVREIKTVFAIDGQTKYKDAIKAINDQQKLLNAELKKNAAQFELAGDKQGELRVKIDALNKQIELQRQKITESRTAMERAVAEGKLSSETIQELTKDYYYAEAGLAAMQKQLISTNKDLALQESKLRAAGEAAQAAGKKLQTIGDGMSKVGTALTVGVTAPLMAAAGASVKAAMDFESAFAGVKKTVDATTEQLNELETGIRDMAKEVPATAVEISKVAESAGQLGIKTENILEFSKAMIDLGESTNLSADEAATALAQFANITKMDQSAFGNLGSAIVALGNAGASTEAQITEMALRLAGAGNQVGMSEADIVGFAAALADVGIDAEAGGTALSKVMIQMQLAASTGSQADLVLKKTGKSLRELEMFADTDAKGFKAMAHSMGYTAEEFKGFMDASKSLGAFSQVTGISAAEFKKAYEKDAAGAIQLFVKSLATAKDRGTDAITVLEEMGITEVRMRDALLRAAGAGDKMSGSIKLSNEAWKENNALTKEASQRYATSESQLKIQKNRITDAAITIGKSLLPVVAELTEDIADAAQAFGKMSPEMQKAALIALGVAASLGPVAKTLGVVTKGVGLASDAWGKYAVKLAAKKAAETAATAATTGLSSATAGTGGLIASLGPAAIAIGAVALAAGGLYLAYRESTRAEREAGEAGEQFAAGIASWRDDIDSATSALQGFNMETIISAEKMAKFDTGISEAQGKIIGLAEKAASESRAYTQKEQDEINKLIGLINDYTQKKIDAYQQQAEVVAAMAAQETNVTLTRANELIKGAEDAKAETIAIAEAKYKDLIGLAETEYGHLGEKDKEAYDKQIAAAAASKQAQIDAANATHGETLAIIQQKYADYNKEDMANLERMAGIDAELAALEQQKTERTAKQIEEREAQLNGASLGNVERAKIELANDFWYNGEKNRLLEELGKSYDEAGQANLDNWIGMVLNTELYGGQLDEKTSELVQGVISSFDLLPEKSKKAALDAMQGLKDGMAEKEPSLFEKAGNIATGIISTINRIFDNRSPSHVLEKTGINAGAGLEIGLEKKKDAVIGEAGAIADGVISEAARMANIEASIRAQVISSGVAAAIDSSGVQSRKLIAADAGISAQQNSGGSRSINVSGKIVHEGVNTRGELVDSVVMTMEQLKEEIRMELMLAGG